MSERPWHEPNDTPEQRLQHQTARWWEAMRREIQASDDMSEARERWLNARAIRRDARARIVELCAALKRDVPPLLSSLPEDADER